jgi:hypothetical protein
MMKSRFPGSESREGSAGAHEVSSDGRPHSHETRGDPISNTIHSRTRRKKNKTGCNTRVALTDLEA